MTTTPTWREALEFAAETKSSDWPERCQQMVNMARKALMSDLKQKPVAWTLKETIEAKGSLYRAPLWFTDPQNTAWVPLYTIGAPQQAEAVPQKPKLIGWRTSDYLMETADKAMADNWSVHHEMLPIFEGDPYTKLAAAPKGQP